MLRLVRGKIAVYNEHPRVISARHGCHLVDLWAFSDHLLWAREHVLPWVGRHMQHRSSGEGVTAKRSDLSTLDRPVGAAEIRPLI
ncbi:MAG: hypothetical protein ACR2LX_12155 [Jatrophihabitans sp.]